MRISRFDLVRRWYGTATQAAKVARVRSWLRGFMSHRGLTWQESHAAEDVLAVLLCIGGLHPIDGPTWVQTQRIPFLWDRAGAAALQRCGLLRMSLPADASRPPVIALTDLAGIELPKFLVETSRMAGVKLHQFLALAG